MQIAKFNIAISELVDIPNPDGSQHPFATMAKFIFADDKPNGNHQGVKVEEFPNIIKSAVGMPIKMNFTGMGVSNHGGSIPIGHIKNLEASIDGTTNLLIAEAMLWKEEFPDEIDYLKVAYAEGKAPGISYEIAFKDYDTEDGTQWIKDTTTMAATFVHNPAYGSRTHLLALASLDEEDRNTEILALAAQIQTEQETNNEGGNLMEEELKKAQAEIERLTAELASRDTKISDLEGTLATAETEKQTALAEKQTVETELNGLKETAKIDGRVRQYIEAGFKMEADAAKADAKKTVFASFDDAQWDMYLEELKAIKPAAPAGDRGGDAFASLSRINDVPRVEVSDVEIVNLKDAMKQLARPHSV